MSPLEHQFFDEARDNLDAMERGLLSLDSQGTGQGRLDAIFRAAHSIKGGAAAFRLTDIVQLTHGVESLLERLRSGQLLPDAALVDLLLEAVDAARNLLARQAPSAGPAVDAAASLLQRLRAATPDKTADIAARCLEIRIGPLEQIENADAIAHLFRDIAGLGEITPLPVERADSRAFRVRTGATDQELMDLFAFHVARDQVVIRPVLSVPAQEVSIQQPETATIRVALNKLDHLGSLVEAFAANHAALERCSRALGPGAHAQLVASLDSLHATTDDLQRVVGNIRMVPVGLAFGRFTRLLRQLSHILSKRLVLVTSGESIELDKALVEQIIDPVTHLVRNSCDHGIELPKERRAAGKPEVGTITLSVCIQGTSVLVEVHDDGRGLSREGVMRAARKRGIQVPEQMSDAQVWQLVFIAGVSTAETITNVSGRGVGMDVVRRNIAAMGGSVEISSEAGRGTRVSIRVPMREALTL